MVDLFHFCLNRDFHPESYTYHDGRLHLKKEDGSLGRLASTNERFYYKHPQSTIALKTSLVFFTALLTCAAISAIVITCLHFGGYGTWNHVASAMTPGVVAGIVLGALFADAVLVGSLLCYNRRKNQQPPKLLPQQPHPSSSRAAVTEGAAAATSAAGTCRRRRRSRQQQPKPQSQPQLNVSQRLLNALDRIYSPRVARLFEGLLSGEPQIDLSNERIEDLPQRKVHLSPEDAILIMGSEKYREEMGGKTHVTNEGGSCGRELQVGIAPIIWQYLRPGEFYLQKMETKTVIPPTLAQAKMRILLPGPDMKPRLVLFIRNRASHQGEAQPQLEGEDKRILKPDGVPSTYSFPIPEDGEAKLPDWVVRRLSGIKYCPETDAYVQKPNQVYTQVVFECEDG